MISNNKSIFLLLLLLCITSTQCATSFNSFSSVQFLPTSFNERSNRFVSSSSSQNPASKLFSSGGLSNSGGLTNFQRPDFNLNFGRNFQFSPFIGNDFTRNNLPRFTNGISNSDPYLLNGPQAKNVANYLYGKELFFNDIPHVRSLLRNQDERRFNGLPLHRLGSLRYGSPWYRFDRKTTNPFFL